MAEFFPLLKIALVAGVESHDVSSDFSCGISTCRTTRLPIFGLYFSSMGLRLRLRLHLCQHLPKIPPHMGFIRLDSVYCGI
ncbi:hypothetical protein E4T56_gene12218 [Termitomyces sp. T112]|nr:hypothetical protein E4T56_gene12218 [Termitomyces sp. T112]